MQESSDVSPDKQRFLSWAPGPAAHSAVRQTETSAPRLPLGCCVSALLDLALEAVLRCCCSWEWQFSALWQLAESGCSAPLVV